MPKITDRKIQSHENSTPWHILTNYELARDKKEKRASAPALTAKQKRRQDWRKLRESFAAETGQIVLNGGILQEFNAANGLGIRNAVIETGKIIDPPDRTVQWIKFLIRQCALYLHIGEATKPLVEKMVPIHRAETESWWGKRHWKQQVLLHRLSAPIARDERNDSRRENLRDRQANQRISAVSPPPPDPRRVRRPKSPSLAPCG